MLYSPVIPVNKRHGGGPSSTGVASCGPLRREPFGATGAAWTRGTFPAARLSNNCRRQGRWKSCTTYL